MKKISLRGIKEVLSERELRNVKGGSGDKKCYYYECHPGDDGGQIFGMICIESSDSCDVLYDLFSDACWVGGTLDPCY